VTDLGAEQFQEHAQRHVAKGVGGGAPSCRTLACPAGDPTSLAPSNAACLRAPRGIFMGTLATSVGPLVWRANHRAPLGHGVEELRHLGSYGRELGEAGRG